MGDWQIEIDGRRLDVIGPYCDGRGRIRAMSCTDQSTWAADNSARLPTDHEFDQIYDTADIKVMPNPRDVTRAPLDSLDDDAREAGWDGSQTVAVGKTWVQHYKGPVVNYGWFVPADQVRTIAGVSTWKGIKVYRVSSVGAYVIQLPGGAHGATHVDYSQAGYCVREASVRVDQPADETPTPVPDTIPAPYAAALPLWAAVVARARADLDNGVSEDLGRNDGHRIREMVKIYTSGLPDGHRHKRLKPPLNWCALGINAWLTEACGQLGIDKPIGGSSGAQATMNQFKAAGRWVNRRDIKPEHLAPGNVPIWSRPPHNWTGHIGVIETGDWDERMMHTIEANSGRVGDRVAEMDRSIDDPRLFGLGILNDGTPLPAVVDVTIVELPAEVMAETPEPTWEGSDPIIESTVVDLTGQSDPPIHDGRPLPWSELLGWFQDRFVVAEAGGLAHAAKLIEDADD